ncbi:hypothetical protein SBRCBS47491_005907 [Sporothrix bragantina]|uniref:Moybdenum cofactor oxidoreductase dimerisation domain-containing protein n=1 Tax=Sporothrix bragantina TaxID=671064 RepID=A0ABP0C0G1_9PEZI
MTYSSCKRLFTRYQWQRRDYKLFGPNEGGAPDWDKYPAIQEMPVTGTITGVWVDTKSISKAVKEGNLTAAFSLGTAARAAPGEWKSHVNESKNSTPVTATGYAYSGGRREIVRVDVSVDGGKTWDQATLLDQKQAEYDDETDRQKRNIVARGRRNFAWKRWRYDGVVLGDSPSEVVVKAIDSAYNTQFEKHDGMFNVRSNLAMAWHRV